MRGRDLFERHDAAAALLPVRFAAAEAAVSRAHLARVLRALGAAVPAPRRSAAGAAGQDGSPHVLVVHTGDYAYASTVYAVPEPAVTPPLAAALEAAPRCFAAPDDAHVRGWGGVLRLLAVWGLDGLGAERFHAVMVEDSGARHGHADLPGRAELRALGGAWSAHAVLTLERDGAPVDPGAPWLSYSYRAMYAFRQSM